MGINVLTFVLMCVCGSFAGMDGGEKGRSSTSHVGSAKTC